MAERDACERHDARQIECNCTTCKAREACEKGFGSTVHHTGNWIRTALLSSQFDILSTKTGFTVYCYWVGGSDQLHISVEPGCRRSAKPGGVHRSKHNRDSTYVQYRVLQVFIRWSRRRFSESSIAAPNLTATCSGTKVTWATTNGLRHSSKR